MAVDIYSPTPHDPLSLQELALWRAIMAYRAENGLPPIPLSQALTATAGRHVLDTRENIWAEGETPAPGTNYHSWSDAPYRSDGSTPEAMWFAPARLGTGYADPGYEITAVGYADGPAALAGWKSSPAHDAILTNSGAWADRTFTAIGIGVETSSGPGPYGGRVFHVWFGETPDAPPLVRGTGLGERIVGTRFADRLGALGGDDVVLGGRGHDEIGTGPGADHITGGYGDDRITGGPGGDVLTGGPGADVFVFSAAGRDRVTDFQPGPDRLHLATIDADAGRAGNQAFRFIGDAPLDGTAGQLRYGGNGVIAGDVDGDGRAELVILITGAAALEADDFLL